jgi:predicted CoA-binding protein
MKKYKDQDLGGRLKNSVVAVVGATTDKSKWGYKVLKRLGELGFRVVGVNPKYREIEGIRCYGDLEEMGIDLGLVGSYGDVLAVTVVPPEVTEKVVEKCIDLGVRMIWMQPGSESEAAVNRAKQAGMEVMSGACIVVDGLGEGWG